MDDKRKVEHYRDRELVCELEPEPDGWRYTVTVVTHRGDNDELLRDSSDRSFSSDVEALRAASERGRALIDGLLEDEEDSA